MYAQPGETVSVPVVQPRSVLGCNPGREENRIRFHHRGFGQLHAMTKPTHSARSRAIRGCLPRAFIEEDTTILVRFNEVDALCIVWHGHYLNYFEEGRRALGRRLGIDYPAFIERRIAIPVIHIEVNFLAPAKLSDSLVVTARLLKSDSARLDFNYEVRRAADATLLATGSTSQVFTTLAGQLILNWPPFMLEKLNTWEALWQQP